MRSVKDRFMEKINKTKNCWVWTASITTAGYGKFWDGKKLIDAHRMSFILFKKNIPKNKYICHSCDNKKCVNPKHLWAGTQTDNMKDCLQKGRYKLLNKHPMAKLTKKQVKYIRSSKVPTKLLAKKYNVSRSHINLLKQEKRIWKDI